MLDNINLTAWFKPLCVIAGGLLLQQLLLRIILPALRGQDKDRAGAIVLDAANRPITLFIMATALYLALRDIPLPAFLPLERLYRSALIIAFFEALYNLSGNRQGRLGRLFERLGFHPDPILSNIVSDFCRALIVVLGTLTLISEWGYDISGPIAGLGLGGLALAMASKDSLANIFGGFVILTDKPFGIGDWIQAAGVEGAVEQVSFRSTRIRTTEQALVHMPNSNLTNVAITNFSRRGKRRADFTIGLSYAANKKQITDFTALLQQALFANPDLSQEDGDILVGFGGYGETGLNINITFFTLATDLPGHLRGKEAVNLTIMDIVETTGVSLAAPSRSVYFKTPLAVTAVEREVVPGK